jgi:uncharacterized protein YcgL (UPF0745 family)
MQANILSVNNGFPFNMTVEQLKPNAVVEIHINGRQQNCLIISVEKVKQGFKGERFFMAMTQQGDQFRASQLSIIRLVNHSLTYG